MWTYVLRDGQWSEVWSADGKAWFSDSSCTVAVSDGDMAHARPVPIPPAIFGIGQNYRRHAEEMGGKFPEHPTVFMKNPACVASHGDAIQLPRTLKSEKVDFEAELALVIGVNCRNVSEADAYSVIKGVTCANDVSARDWQREWGGGQFCKGKGFDTFCPIGPFGVTLDQVGDPQELRLVTRVNGAVMQDWTTADMIFPIRKLIAFLSADTTLLEGTVILTGTPHGVGTARTPPVYLQDGDTVEIEIENIGILKNSVRA